MTAGVVSGSGSAGGAMNSKGGLTMKPKPPRKQYGLQLGWILFGAFVLAPALMVFYALLK